MKLIDKINQRNTSHPFFFFEFFPPKTDQGFENLLPRIARLAKLHPLALSITWGAGGTTRDRSLDLAGLTQTEYGLDTILHLTCTNMMQGMVDDALRKAMSSGIQNVLALRGDPPRGNEEWIPIDPRFKHGVDLVSYIRSKPEFSSHFCIGVAAYPDGHPDKLVDPETELQYLKEKVDAGADFIITQLYYDVEHFLDWVKKVRAKGITIPIIPGIMPIQTYASFVRLIRLTGCKVPDSVMSEMDSIKHDDQLVKEYGVKLAVEMCQRITTEGGIIGVHFCTLNLEKSVQRVVEILQWSPATAHKHAHNRLIEDAKGDPTRTVTPGTAAADARLGLSGLAKSNNEAGSGELNNADTWDDFPNGRFGDFKSPAFGQQDPWGNALAITHDFLSDWGTPKSHDDLTLLFLRYLRSETGSTPFSEGPLSTETQQILSHLEKLTQRGWWTVGSQPAVDGAKSEDEVVGWGPRGGYVFQKSFVEFFCDDKDLESIEKRIEEKGGGWVQWFAGNWKGDCRSNVSEDGRNAVTWGVFPGQEIVQTTIIEKQSFLSWKEEAFSIWAKWASFYRPDSPEREVLDSVKQDKWLVSVVHHDYKDPEALWRFFEV
ncbi:methylenetetrahydrofolate reductase 1 [Marasmius crinis-equi]|uniref:Methylenetetrahydrofolate reductase 1 n=1 Tax=Marasmius crinis-equi TaxID=585013 RepID=A0ABR3G085_9AGAR